MNFAKLSDVAPAAASSHRPKPEDVVWHLGLDQIESGTGAIHERKLAPASEAGSSTVVFDGKNVLYSKLRPYLNKVVCPDTIGIATSELVPMRPDTTRLNRNYLCYYLRSPAFVSWISDKGAGAKMPRAKMDAFWKHEIPLPPLEDQKRIAYLLSKVEGLIAQRKQHLQQLDDLLKSVFLDMFGDPKSNPKEFEIRRLSDFYHDKKAGVKCGPFGSALRKSELTRTGIPVWNMDNISLAGEMTMPFRMWISAAKHEDLMAYSVHDRDILISRAGTVGKMCVAYSISPSIISTNLIRLRLNENLHSEYFVALMTNCKGRVGRLKTGPDGTFTHMNTGVLDKLEFPYPPVKLQSEYVRIEQSIRAKKESCLRSLAQLIDLNNAVAQLAFKGELNVSRIIVPKGIFKPAKEQPAERNNAKATGPTFELPTPVKGKLKNSKSRKTALKNLSLIHI